MLLTWDETWDVLPKFSIGQRKPSVCTLFCDGTKRSKFKPPPQGEIPAYGPLVELRRVLSARRAPSSDSTWSNRRRQGVVLAAVTGVLEAADQPLSVSAIHAAVGRRLARSVPYPSVKDALSAHTRGGDRRFRRVGRGLYARSHEAA
jgi:hypothetical protein